MKKYIQSERGFYTSVLDYFFQVKSKNFSTMSRPVVDIDSKLNEILNNLRNILKLEEERSRGHEKYFQQEKLKLFYDFILHCENYKFVLKNYVEMLTVISSRKLEIPDLFMQIICKKLIYEGNIKNPIQAVGIWRENLDILQILKKYLSPENLENWSKIIKNHIEMALFSRVQNAIPSEIKEIIDEHKRIKGITGFLLNSSTLRSKAIQYLTENENDIKICEDFVNQIHEDFTWKAQLKKLLLNIFIKVYSGMVKLYKPLENKSFVQSKSFEIDIQVKELETETGFNVIYNSKLEKFGQISADISILLKNNQVGSCIRFEGISVFRNNPVLEFNYFGLPLFQHFDGINKPLSDGEVLYFIREIANSALCLTSSGIFLDFLHPGNVFLLDNELAVFPNSFAVCAFAESCTVNIKLFKAPEYSEDIDDSEALIAYSLGIIAIYLKTRELENEKIQKLIEKNFEVENQEFFLALVGEKTQRIRLTTIIELLG